MAPARQLSLVTASAAPVITIADAKAYLRADEGETDALLGMLCAAAIAKFDGPAGCLGRALVKQTWKLSLPCFADEISIPLPPLIDVDAIKYFDPAGAEQTLPVGDYLIDRSEPAALIARGAIPDTQERPDAVSITFTAGFGATAEAVPGNIRAAILQTLGTLYETRESVTYGTGTFQSAPMTGLDLCAEYKVIIG